MVGAVTCNSRPIKREGQRYNSLGHYCVNVPQTDREFVENA